MMKGLRENILIILLIGLLCAICVNFIFHSLYWAFFPYEIVQDEGFFTERISWLIKGKSLYHPPTSYPFIMLPYTPLFYIFCIPFFLFIGKRIIVGRIVSLIFTFLTAFYLYKIIAKRTPSAVVIEGESRWWNRISLGGIVAAGLFFSSKIIFSWAPLSRSDMAAAFFSVLALYVVSQNKNNKRIIFAALISSMAIFAKQSFFVSLVAIFLYLLFTDYSKSLKFLCASVFFIGSSFIILQIATHGNFALQTLSSSPFGYFTFDRIKGFVSEFTRINYIPLLLLLFFLFFVAGHTLYKLYFFLHLPLLITLGLSGSVTNHLIGIFIAMCILVGLLAQRISEEPGYLARNLVAIFLLFFLIFPNQSFYYFNFKQKEINPWTNRAIFDKVVNYIRKSEGDVLSEYASFAFLAKKDVLIHPLVVSPGYKLPQTNLTQLLIDCQARRFSCIVYKAFMPLALGNALYDNYYLVDVLKEQYSDWLGGSNTWFIMKPRTADQLEIPDKNIMYCSSLSPLSAHQDAWHYRNDGSHGGNVISLGGKFYAKGLGVNSNSTIVYGVSGYNEFKAVIGLDDELDGLRPNYSNVIFKVYLDNLLAFESEIFYQDTPPQEISIPLNHAETLKLIVTDAGSGAPDGNLIWGDHADWADARLIKEGR